MRAQHIVWNGQSGWRTKGEVGDPSLVLYFGTREALACGRRYEELRAMFPAAHVLGCSTGGQINNNDIGEAWEWSDQGVFAIDVSNEAYKLGINYIIYAMTR